MAMVAAFDLDPRQYDVLKSYYHAKLDQRVYCHPPDGMGVDGDKLLVKVWIEGGSLDPDRMLRSERKKWISTCHPLCPSFHHHFLKHTLIPSSTSPTPRYSVFPRI